MTANDSRFSGLENDVKRQSIQDMLRRQDRTNIFVNILIVFLVVLGQGTFALSLII